MSQRAHVGAAPVQCDDVHLASSNTGSFTETELGEIRFPVISAHILEKVCQYFCYKLRWTNA